jgi:hypothetical protein
MLTRRKFIDTTLVAGTALAPRAQQARSQPASKRTIVAPRFIFVKQIRQTRPGIRVPGRNDRHCGAAAAPRPDLARSSGIEGAAVADDAIEYGSL